MNKVSSGEAGFKLAQVPIRALTALRDNGEKKFWMDAVGKCMQGEFEDILPTTLKTVSYIYN